MSRVPEERLTPATKATNRVHEWAILKLREEYVGVQTRRFRRKLVQAVVSERTCLEEEDLKAAVGLTRPDAFIIDPANCTVVCFEVEDTHAISPKTLRRYTDTWFVLDAEGWDLVLVTTNRYGENVTPVSLSKLYAVALADAVASPPSGTTGARR